MVPLTPDPLKNHHARTGDLDQRRKGKTRAIQRQERAKPFIKSVLIYYQAKLQAEKWEKKLKEAEANASRTREDVRLNKRIPLDAEDAGIEASFASHLAEARARSQEALGRTPKDPDTVPRAWFIRGLVAAERGDSGALAQAIAALPPSKQADLSADRQELQGRATLLANQPAEALVLFEQSAAGRQQALDYRGMARALALAGDAALRSNHAAEAADLFLRAGRSALLQGDSATALPLLKRAEDLARQTAQPAIVEEVTRLRKVAAERSTKA